ncbi:MAG: hypothetical protein K2N36_05425 [Ruminiclostridium sp.]|nr:hypothetical protein [Ruminiclostridium sp.]
MERFKQVLKKIFFLPPLLTVLIALPSFVFCFYVLGMGIDGVISYISYALSAYALVITVTGFSRIVRALRKGIDSSAVVKKVMAHPLGGRYLTDKLFRAEVSLYTGFAINILYAGLKMVSGIVYVSVWFISLSVYYVLLAAMRLLLLTYTLKKRKNRDKRNLAAEYKRYRWCGALLVFMTLALSGIILFIIKREGGYDYPGVLIYVMAMYAFYSVISAGINIVKFRRHASPVLSAAKAVNLTAALVSMLALETAMLSQFGTGDDMEFRQTMLAVSGGMFCAFILGTAIYMIVHGGRQAKTLGDIDDSDIMGGSNGREQ